MGKHGEQAKTVQFGYLDIQRENEGAKQGQSWRDRLGPDQWRTSNSRRENLDFLGTSESDCRLNRGGPWSGWQSRDPDLIYRMDLSEKRSDEAETIRKSPQWVPAS